LTVRHDGNVPLRSLALGIVVLLAGCSLFAGHGGATTLDGVTLIRHDPSDSWPAGLLGGRVEVVDGCVALAGKDWRAFVLWPDGFDLRKRDGGLEVVGDGFVIPIGSTIEGGGGLMHLGNAQSLAGDAIPEPCQVKGESYAYVGEVVSVGATSDVVAVTGRSSDLSGDQALLEGRFAVRDRCLVIDTGGAIVVPIWPRDYRMVDVEGTPRLVDANGTPIGDVGDPVSIGGGVIPVSRADDATPNGVPDACRSFAHYWLAGYPSTP
jgi:hypothetical protein